MRTMILLLWIALPAMAGRFFDVPTTLRIGVGSISTISPPITIACWAAPAAYSNCVALAVGNANADERVQITWILTPGASANAISAAGSSAGFSANWSYPTNGTWSHSAAVFTSSTSRALYTNGVLAVSDTSSIIVANLDRVFIGARKSSSGFGAGMYGSLAEAAVWNVALTAAEIASLANGAAPFMIRPASLVFYAPLTGREASSEWNYVGTTINLTNSPAPGTSHPRIFYP